MDNKSRILIDEQYSNLVDKHQGDMNSLSDNANYKRKHQEIKFSFLKNFLGDHDSLLDVGCGLGDLNFYCRDAGWKGIYAGIDISKKMVAFAQSRLTPDQIREIDLLEDPFEESFDVVASISTIQQRPRYQDPVQYLKAMIKKMFSISRKTTVFDVFSSKFADYQVEEHLYIDPSELLDYCYSLTNRLHLINDYSPHQVMMVLYKHNNEAW